MKIERVQQTEQRLSVELRGLFADVDDNGYLTVNGEVIAIGNGPQNDFNVVLTAYDGDGRILYTSDGYIGIDEFIGFETFTFCSKTGPVAQVRVHVKPS